MAASTRPHRPRTLAPILRLPLELRLHVYSHLLPEENVSHPLPSVGITSVSHRPPSSSLLKIHPIITDEILDYFYSISTWKLVVSHAFNFFRIDPELRRLASSPSLGSIRQVEVVFFYDVLLLQKYPSFGLENFSAEIEKRASRACDVLSQAPHLRTVIVSWCDSTDTSSWTQKTKILAPLKKLSEAAGRRRPATFRVGKVTGPDGLERSHVAEALRDVVGRNHRLESEFDENEDSSSSLRMLAFDMRQEGHRVSTKHGSFPLPSVSRSGWRGAPPSLEVPLETESEFEVFA